MIELSPYHYEPSLTQFRLEAIASLLLEVLHQTEDDMSTPYDCGYTRGTASFGRMRNALILLHFSKRYSDWYDLRHAGMDVTCSIGGIPFRFFSDDHRKPKKKNFFRKNVQDDLFSTDESLPVFWRFVVEKPISEDDQATVYFVGANAAQEIICVWKYEEKVRVLTSVGDTKPEAVENPEPEVGPLIEVENKKLGRSDS